MTDNALVPINGPEITETQIQGPGLFGAANAVETVAKATEVADALAAVIKAKKLASPIQGKEYVRCEGWTLLGSMLGVFPVCTWTKPVDGGWEARVEARTRQGEVVGAAEAQCLRSEQNWKSRDDYALRSMAQTRATSKALRLPLGFIVVLAGYEATPAEEMVGVGEKSRPTPPEEDLTPVLEESIALIEARKAGKTKFIAGVERIYHPLSWPDEKKGAGRSSREASGSSEPVAPKAPDADAPQPAPASIFGDGRIDDPEDEPERCPECDGEVHTYKSRKGPDLRSCSFGRALWLENFEKTKNKEAANRAAAGHFYEMRP